MTTFPIGSRVVFKGFSLKDPPASTTKRSALILEVIFQRNLNLVTLKALGQEQTIEAYPWEIRLATDEEKSKWVLQRLQGHVQNTPTIQTSRRDHDQSKDLVCSGARSFFDYDGGCLDT